MEGHNRTYPSLRWVRMDDEQIVWKRGSFDVQSRSRSDSAVRHNRKVDAGQALTVGFLLRIPAGGPDFLARAEQLVAMA